MSPKGHTVAMAGQDVPWCALSLPWLGMSPVCRSIGSKALLVKVLRA